MIQFTLQEYVDHHVHFGIHGFGAVSTYIGQKIQSEDPDEMIYHIEFRPDVNLAHIWPIKEWRETSEHREAIRQKIRAEHEARQATVRLEEERKEKLRDKLKTLFPFATRKQLDELLENEGDLSL